MATRQALLEALADAISREVGFETVAINTYRPESDDYSPLIIVGAPDVHAAIADSTLPRSSWVEFLSGGEEIHGCYFLPAGSIEWPDEIPSYTPAPSSDPTDPRSWLPDDALFVPMQNSAGEVMAIISVDDPRSGRRPSDAQLSYLSALVTRATRELEAIEEREE